MINSTLPFGNSSRCQVTHDQPGFDLDDHGVCPVDATAPRIGITFGAFDLFHAGHVLMLQEARTVCDHLLVCIQTDPSLDRPAKNQPIQSIVERQIQVAACRYVDQTLVYNTEADVLEVLASVPWDVRILGEEYRSKPFTGREESIDRCYFNRRPHRFSSSELRGRVAQNTPQTAAAVQ